MKIVVSYDGTDNDVDALALGHALANGETLAVAYVRHKEDADDGAEALLDAVPGVERHVVVNASTPEGLRELAGRVRADVIVFGSEYRTTPGHVTPQASAARLLDGGPVAVALAPLGWRGAIERVVAVADGGDRAPHETAASLGLVVESVAEADLVVFGSMQGEGTRLGAAALHLIELLRCPVLVLPYGVALSFT